MSSEQHPLNRPGARQAHASFDARDADHAHHFTQIGFECSLLSFTIAADGQIQNVCAGGLAILGYSLPELRRKKLVELFPRDQESRVNDLWLGRLRGGTQVRRLLLLRRDGASIPVTVLAETEHRQDAGQSGFTLMACRPIPVEALARELYSLDNIRNYYDLPACPPHGNIHMGLHDSPSEDLTTASERLLAEFLENVGALRGKAVLDVGCGVGRAAIKLVTDCGCDHVDAITISEKQLAWFNEFAARHPEAARRIRLLVMDANEMTLPELSYDDIIAIESLAHMDRTRVLPMVFRLLKPGGRFAFCDPYPLEGGILHAQTGSQTIIGIDQSVRLLRKYGFRNIRVVDWTDRVAPGIKQLYAATAAMAKHAVARAMSCEETFAFAERFYGAPLSDSVKRRVVSDVLMAARGDWEPLARTGYCFISADKP